jgi:hypothetical protein
MATDFTAPSTQKTLINKLRALARMADEASTPDEAALASRRMQELLLKHNLTRADVEKESNRSRRYSGRSYYAGWAKEERESRRRASPSFKAGQESGKGIGLGGALKKGNGSRRQIQ